MIIKTNQMEIVLKTVSAILQKPENMRKTPVYKPSCYKQVARRDRNVNVQLDILTSLRSPHA